MIHKDFNQPRNRILASTDHRTFAVVAIRLELRVLLEVRDTLVHIVTAVHSTLGARARLRGVDRTHQLRYRAGLHRPVKIVGLVGCRVLVVLWSH